MGDVRQELLLFPVDLTFQLWAVVGSFSHPPAGPGIAPPPAPVRIKEMPQLFWAKPKRLPLEQIPGMEMPTETVKNWLDWN